MNPGAVKTLLIVDDEPEVCTSLRRLLRREPYAVLTASGGREALAILKRHPIQVILSDSQMPDMDGITFLDKAHACQPDAVLLLLSGDAEAGARTAREAALDIWKILSKPWNPDAFVLAVRDAFSLWDAQTHTRD